MSNKILAVLVNYKSWEDSIEAVNSLLSQNLPFYKIVVVDNDSPNDSYNKLKSYFNKNNVVDIIKSEYNGGFSYGNNYGIKYSLDKYDTDFFLLINNDTLSQKNLNEVFLKNYYDLEKKYKKVVLTGKIYYESEKDVIWYAGGWYDKKKIYGYHCGVNKKDCDEFDKIKEVSFVSGCLMFFSKELISNVGYLPEEYFLYFEDVDYSLQITDKDYRMFYVPEAVIWHKVGRSTGCTVENINYYYLNRNRLILARKRLDYLNLFVFLFFFFSSRIFRFFQFLLIKKKAINTFKGSFEGISKKIRL